MKDIYGVLKSNKVGLDSEEGYVLIRNGISFLRILGGEPEWTVMTATASEDDSRIRVCPERRRLVEAALRLGAERGGSPRVEKDWLGREYVKIGTITREGGESEEDFQSENDTLFQRFFEIFDTYRSLCSQSAGEMRELHGVLAVDDKDSDVYLSDGVSLGSDGSLPDCGR